MADINYPKEKQKLVDEALHKYFPPPNRYSEIVYKAMHHSVFAGGKRFRPVITLLVAEAFGGDVKEVLPTACAIEFIHTYSLIHDDLPAIDNDELRRGKPTCHVLFGEDVAILAGDALFAEAFYLVASTQRAKDSNQVVKVIQELAKASGVRGMVGGQVLDIFSAGKKVSLKTLDYIHTRKTGKLITAAARVGAIISDVSEEKLELITEYAYNLGLAFQIVDDILDIVGEDELLGKKTGSDERELKATFPSAFGISRAREYAKQYVEKAKMQLGKLDVNAQPLLEIAQFAYERKT